MTEEKWITIKEVVIITGLSIPTIHRYIKEGVLESQRPGKNGRPIVIDYYSIPTYMRRGKK